MATLDYKNISNFEADLPIDNSRANYELTGLVLQNLSAEFLDQAPKIDNSHGFVCYTISGDSKFANIGRTIEREVFEATFGNDKNVMEREYNPYDKSSTFFVVFQEDEKKPVGVLRIIRESEAGLKTVNDIQNEPLNLKKDKILENYGISSLEDSWDVGTLAVLPEYRGKLNNKYWASIILYRALYVSARNEGIKYLVSVMDKSTYKGLRMMGIPFEPILDSPEFSYLDSEVSYAVIGKVDEFFDNMQIRYDKIKQTHPLKSVFFRQAMGRLMLGNKIDNSIVPTLSK